MGIMAYTLSTYFNHGIGFVRYRELLSKRSFYATSFFVCFILVLLQIPLSASTLNAKTSHDAISITYIKIDETTPAGVPSYLLSPDSTGTAGAKLAIDDANITGKFLGHHFALTTHRINTLTAAETPIVKDINRSAVVLLDAPTSNYMSVLSFLIDIAPDTLFINVANNNANIRRQLCGVKQLHTTPSFQMKTDALAQWFRTKRLNNILAVYGSHENDLAFLSAFEQSARKFKLNIIETKAWDGNFDLRRAAFAEIPVFTRTDRPYSAIFAADFNNNFAYSLPFNTYHVVPIVGSAGLKPLGWHFTHEQWGARQLQNRFVETYRRPMNEIDFAAYAAVMTVSAAAQSHSPMTSEGLYNAIVNDDFSLAAYKGRPLSFRPATGQLRQPIALAHEDALVIHAPLPGFLHQSNELDTLGNTQSTGNRSSACPP